MSKQIPFRSVFSPYFNSFLNMKEQLGVGRIKFENVFLEFDRFFLAAGVTEVQITRELINGWSEGRVNDKARTLYDKHSIMGQFCKYLCHLGYECYLHRLPRQNWPPFISYIYSREQMEDIFKASDALTLPYKCMSSFLIAIPATLRLLYSTGMRIGEAVALKNEDVDLVRQRILLKKTKNQIERLAPICSSLLDVLIQYKSCRDKMPIKGIQDPKAPFFVSTVGRQLTKISFNYWFKKILRDCGIPARSDGQGPRVHDLRHTAAIHSLVQMVQNGMDIYCAMPILSVFLGHKSLKGTETYVRLTREMYPDLIEMERPITSFVFPRNLQTEMDYGND